MRQTLKLTATKWLNNPTTRALIILGVLVLAALIGGAPSDAGGNGR